MISGNPFNMVYTALWDLAEGSEALTDVVRLGNRIRFDFTQHTDPIKDEVSEADLPELMLISASSGGNMHETSNTSRINRQYEWVISTGQMSVQRALHMVEWYLFAAMTNWKEVLGALRWPASATDGFVKRSNLMSIGTGYQDAARNRGIAGWSSIWGVEVEMHFATADLYEVGTPATTTVAPTTS